MPRLPSVIALFTTLAVSGSNGTPMSTKMDAIRKLCTQQTFHAFIAVRNNCSILGQTDHFLHFKSLLGPVDKRGAFHTCTTWASKALHTPGVWERCSMYSAYTTCMSEVRRLCIAQYRYTLRCTLHVQGTLLVQSVAQLARAVYTVHSTCKLRHTAQRLCIVHCLLTHRCPVHVQFTI